MRFQGILFVCGISACASLTAHTVIAQEKSVRPGINKPFENPDVKDFINKFETESREIYLQRKDIVDACRLGAGMQVADIGAGTGLFTRLFAAAVGPKGRVYAVDIAPPFLEHIQATCKAQKIDNVKTVVCKPDSVELPVNSIDLAFICDTYHHFEFPSRTMQSLSQALRPGGQVVLIDFHRIDGVSREWVMNHVRAGQDIVTREITSCGFRVADEQKLLKENYFVRFEKRDLAAPKPGGVVDYAYKKIKQGDLKMAVHFPPDWKAGDHRPAIVFFFGGGWNQGRITQFESQAAHLAKRGMVAARADYRVKSRHDVTPMECVEDAKSAVRWLREHSLTLGIDGDRLAAAGGSAGGHIAACTSCTPGLDADAENRSISSRPNALVLFNPVLRFQGVPQLAERIGNNDDKAKLISPTLHLSKETPPTLLLFGKDDRLLEQGQEFIKRAQQLGQRTELFTAEGVGHGFFNRPPWLDKTTVRMDEFLESLGYLKK